MVKNIDIAFAIHLTLWRPATFGDFREKKHWNARGFVQEFLWSSKRYQPSQKFKNAASLVACAWKKFFWLEGADFLWVTS